MANEINKNIKTKNNKKNCSHTFYKTIKRLEFHCFTKNLINL